MRMAVSETDTPMDSVNHVDEELLERYSLGRIEGDEAAPPGGTFARVPGVQGPLGRFKRLPQSNALRIAVYPV
jgi:hypothetical protein